MAPEDEFLEDEEQQDAQEQRGEDARGRELLEGRRQERQHRHAKQRADRVADEPGNQLRANRILNEKKAGGNKQTAEPANEAQADRDKERRHAQ